MPLRELYSGSYDRDPELALLFDRGREDPQSLNDAERVRFFYFMLGFVRIAQNTHHQFEQGLMSQDVWDGYRESILRMLARPGSRQWWADNAARFSRSFRTFLDSELERRAARQGRFQLTWPSALQSTHGNVWH